MSNPTTIHAKTLYLHLITRRIVKPTLGETVSELLNAGKHARSAMEEMKEIFATLRTASDLPKDVTEEELAKMVLDKLCENDEFLKKQIEILKERTAKNLADPSQN